MLPPETLELTFVHVARRDLPAVLAVSSLFHLVAARVLYRALADVTPTRSLGLLKTLAHNDVYATLVRRLDLEWSENVLTANFLRLLHRVLRRLTRLFYLGLEFSIADNLSNLAWILPECAFSLRVFASSMRCEPALARFLETQPDMIDISLRGISPSDAFTLSARALPRLQHLRTVRVSSPHITADFIRGRPVESVSMSLYLADTAASLDSLLLSTRPIRRLTIMLFDELDSPASLVAAIATRLPTLEALHAIVLARRLTQESLVETVPALSQFTALRYLTFMAPGSAMMENGQETELEIVRLWHRACPTLQTIVLSRGVLWGHGSGGRWSSLDDEP